MPMLETALWCGRTTSGMFNEDSEGVCEIWLTSEDTGAYGRDIGTDLPSLLWELVKEIPEGAMLRLGMTNPPYILEHLEAALALFDRWKMKARLFFGVPHAQALVLKHSRMLALRHSRNNRRQESAKSRRFEKKGERSAARVFHTVLDVKCESGLKEMAKILNHPRVYAFLHVPVQSASDSVLMDMRREYCCADFKRVVDFLKENSLSVREQKKRCLESALRHFRGPYTPWNLFSNGLLQEFCHVGVKVDEP
ncbi:Threonylcarbamoyladenosine tRNA methylthiotransferase [Triplophysa tibetana]|uniref:Threonylcarbamoyladenosine tRNA methylthiotransferase n=1 Tax=Triplophysa tibetana TaxID=1572043 RepID=A0A5A9N303_9TELE|nr:Threonylcarbamoyladenosine tRNA methylthiotransferase [Triplophysa tibetana]